MADIADMAGEREEFVHLGNIAKSRRPEGPRATGRCLNCEQPLLPEPQLIEIELGKAEAPKDAPRWCDIECYSDWSKRNVSKL